MSANPAVMARPAEAFPAVPEWPVCAGRPAWRMSGGEVMSSVESLVEEVPVALIYNGISHAVMLATPADLEDFALGFSLSEGILATPSELYDLDVSACAEGVEIHLEIASERFMALKERRRSLAGRTGCGLCGVDSLKAAVRTPAPFTRGAAIAAAAVHRAFEALPARQPLHRSTGAAHAAAWAEADGTLAEVREDVGRHNALDKLIGALVRRRFEPRAGFALVTSRASVEMVQKAAGAGIGLLAAISAPTGYATRLAASAGLSLVGMARAGRLTAYTHPDHLCGP